MKSFLLPVCMRIFEMGKKAAGRQVLCTHRWSSDLERVFCALMYRYAATE